MCFVCLLGSLSSLGQTSVLLDIPARLQWQNAKGYCGETSIQMCGLYYGNYTSQNLCRTVAGGEVLIGLNDTLPLNAFSFTYKEWNSAQASPQYMNYLAWVKHYLAFKQPVILTVYIKGLSDPDYDHILPAIGYTAASPTVYASTDQLSFNSCFDTTAFTRAFSTLSDTRSMSGNGAVYTYCIPQNVNYGVAITGIKDPGHVCKPVHLKLDSLTEPNTTLGATPRLMHAWITADSLTAGQPYALLRYNSYLQVPSSNFNPAGASSASYFTATGSMHLLTDTFSSAAGVFYRCVPNTFTGISLPEQNASAFQVYPNPGKGTFTLLSTSDEGDYQVLNSLGQLIQTFHLKPVSAQHFDIDELGLYFIRLLSNNGIHTQRMVVTAY
jgi:hypothetical protein